MFLYMVMYLEERILAIFHDTEMMFKEIGMLELT